MEIIEKIKTDAKAGWAELYAKYAAIQSPVVRLVVLALVALVGIVLFFKFLPWLILLAVVGGIGFVIYAAVTADEKP